jgi:hypothetical protein
MQVPLVVRNTDSDSLESDRFLRVTYDSIDFSMSSDSNGSPLPIRIDLNDSAGAWWSNQSNAFFSTTADIGFRDGSEVCSAQYRQARLHVPATSGAMAVTGQLLIGSNIGSMSDGSNPLGLGNFLKRFIVLINFQ